MRDAENRADNDSNAILPAVPSAYSPLPSFPFHFFAISKRTDGGCGASVLPCLVPIERIQELGWRLHLLNSTSTSPTTPAPTPKPTLKNTHMQHDGRLLVFLARNHVFHSSRAPFPRG